MIHYNKYINKLDDLKVSLKTTETFNKTAPTETACEITFVSDAGETRNDHD